MIFIYTPPPSLPHKWGRSEMVLTSGLETVRHRNLFAVFAPAVHRSLHDPPSPLAGRAGVGSHINSPRRWGMRKMVLTSGLETLHHRNLFAVSAPAVLGSLHDPPSPLAGRAGVGSHINSPRM
jgi:hypothetical protein